MNTIAAALAALAFAGGTAPTEGVPLGKYGKAEAGRSGHGTRVTFTLRNLPAGRTVRAILQAGTPKQPSASFATIGAARVAPAGGTLTWTAQVRFRNQPVAWATVSDGSHVISLLVNGKRVAAGAIPGMR